MQTLSWFWDLYTRGLIDLDPPYQRRSVWNQTYKDYFIDTVLLGFPCPAIFLFQEISPEGSSKYSVVDGKQRLDTVFQFIRNEFPVAETATETKYRGKYFQDLDSEVKMKFWQYQFSVEYLSSSDEKLINNIFDRINKNVAKLTAQELRHARFDGEFIRKVEELTEWLAKELPIGFPQINQKSKKQMKDVELVAQIALLIETGPKSYTQLELDKEFSDRDESWECKDSVEERFRNIISLIKFILDKNPILIKSRLRNQADFYSFVASINNLLEQKKMPAFEIAAERIEKFIDVVDNPEEREKIQEAKNYYEAARSASNDVGPRRTRTAIMEAVLSGALVV